MKRNVVCFYIAMMSLMTTQSFATLGESSASIQVDRSALNATKYKLSTSNQFYNVGSYQVAAVTNIREYVAKNGMVFAVSWNGPLKPNLQQLLGQHYLTLMSEVAKKPHAGRSPVYIKRADIVIESGGHPQSFIGRAYLPTAMPSGMKENEVQ